MNSSFSFSDNTVGFFIEGGIFNAERMERLIENIVKKIDTYGKINLYLEDQGVEHFTLLAVAKEIQFKIEHKKELNKVALVSDRKWIHACGKIVNLFLPIEVKSFDIGQRMEAISWITMH